ncbi:MAG: hypothetical protein AAGA92_02010 [Planctomycetota bacterium]
MTRLVLLLALACTSSIGCKMPGTGVFRYWDSRDQNAPSPMEEDDRLEGWEQYWQEHPEQNKVMNEAFSQ